MPKSRAADKRVVGTRWVSCNHGDAANPDIRCRLVCQEVKTYPSEEFYTATPPLEALRLILSLAADNPVLEVCLLDISRAYFNAEIGREVYVELPWEAGADRSQVGFLNKCLYGTRDAAQVSTHLAESSWQDWGQEGHFEPLHLPIHEASGVSRGAQRRLLLGR